MSSGVRAIWNASNAVTPRCGGIEQPVAGTTRENQLPSNIVANAKTTVSAQRERGAACTGIANAYRVRGRTASWHPQGISRTLPLVAVPRERGEPRCLAERESRSEEHVQAPRRWR